MVWVKKGFVDSELTDDRSSWSIQYSELYSILWLVVYLCLSYFQPKVTRKVKKVAPAPYTTSKPAPKKVVNPLIEKRPRNFGIGKLGC